MASAKVPRGCHSVIHFGRILSIDYCRLQRFHYGEHFQNLQMDMEANGASADIADLEQIVKTSIVRTQ